MIASISTVAESSIEREPTMLANGCAGVAEPLIQTLRDLRSLISALSAGQYSAIVGEVFANSTIGGHVRHVLDHVRAVVEGRRDGTVDYDRRARGTNIEKDIAAADAELARLIGEVERLRGRESGDAIRVRILPARDAQPITLASSLAREVAFVFSHTVHHNATIRSMVVALGLAVPETFGYAPSTLAHKDCCARSEVGACAR